MALTALKDDILGAYAMGYFPMADSADDDEFYWIDPPLRGQLPINTLHIPKRLRSTILQFPYKVTFNTDFTGVINACAQKTDARRETWINAPIKNAFIALHEDGHAHSIECWDSGGALMGGIYGLAIGGAFCAESKFSRARDASKIALVHLCARLNAAGFSILDIQFINDHLLQFGAYEIPKKDYLHKLHNTLNDMPDIHLSGQSEKDIINAFL